MTIDIMLEALEALKDRGDHPDYKQQVIHESICELRRLNASLPDYHRGIWNGAIHVVHMTTAIDLQNALLYDTFGRLAKSKSNLEVSFGEYMEAARKRFGFEAVSTQFLTSGYEVINDLWHDNEANGCHGSDGTYCAGRSDTYGKIPELLKFAEELIQAYEDGMLLDNEIAFRGKRLANKVVELKTDLLTMLE